MSEPNADAPEPTPPVPPIVAPPTATPATPPAPVPPAPAVSPVPAAATPAPPPPPAPAGVPAPRYGEYAPGYVPTQQPATPPIAGYGYPYGQPMAALPGVRKRHTWDVVLTIVLLVLGFFGMLLGVLYAWFFEQPQVLDDYFKQQGMGSFNGNVGNLPDIISVSHIVLYLVAIALSIFLLATKRIAFYVPLAAGVIAAVIFWVCGVSIFMSDPGFLAHYSGN